MRCKSMVKFVPARKKGSGESYQKATKIYPRYQIKLGSFIPEPDMIECNGFLKVIIESDMEGECSCSSYSILRINYMCEKCGGEYYPELPQDQKELSEVFEAILRNLHEDDRESILLVKVEKEIERRKEMDRLHKEIEAKHQKFLESRKKKKKK